MGQLECFQRLAIVKVVLSYPEAHSFGYMPRSGISFYGHYFLAPTLPEKFLEDKGVQQVLLPYDNSLNFLCRINCSVRVYL
jgi:hypothetical protein